MLKAEKAGLWQTPQTLCQEDSWLSDGFQGSLRYQWTRNHVACSRPGQEWAEHWTAIAILEEQTLALVQCLASILNWWGIRAAIQFISITNDQFPLLQRVRSMKRVSFAMLKAEKAGVFQAPQTMFQEVRKSLCCWCRCVTGFCQAIDGHQCSWFRHGVFPTIFLSNVATICK